jgi:hypothetical protein
VQLSYEGYFEQLAKILHTTRLGETFYAMMYGCYLDESFDKKPSGFYTVGGFIAQGVPTFELERSWEKCLVRHGLEYYKASECESARKQFAKFVADPQNITAAERKTLDAVSHVFCKIIGFPVEYDSRNFLALFGVEVVQKDFYDVIKNPNARAVLGENPYRLAYELGMVQAAWTMKELGGGEPKHCVSFVCDEDEEHAETAPVAYRALKKSNPIASQYMCTFSTADEKLCAPLQAADAVIYEIRKVLKYSKKDYETKLREQFGMFADSKIMFYVGHTERVQLEWIASNHKPGEPFNLDEVMTMKLGDNIDTLRI